MKAKGGSYGSGTAQFSQWGSGAGSIAVDTGNNLWITDCGNNRVQEWSNSGTHTANYGTADSSPGQMSCPFGITADSSGNFWVINFGNYRVDKYNNSFAYQSVSFGSKGTGSGQFEYFGDLTAYPALTPGR